MTSLPRHAYRTGLLLTAGAAAFLVLGAGALGIVGDGRADRAYLVVLAVLVLGSALARLRPAGMVRTLLAAALAQVLVPLVLFLGDAPGTAGASRLDVAGLTAMYAGLFVLGAWCFRRSTAGVRELPRGVTA